MTTISPEQMAIYKATARRRAARRNAELDDRLDRAWATARCASALLKKRFGADQVMVFGSLLERRLFHAHSDIDLAAWGIPEHAYLKAAGAVLDLDPEFSVDLVRMEEARESIRAIIEDEGRTL